MFQKIDTTSLLSRKYEEQVNKDTIEKLGIEYRETTSLEEAMPQLDVLYMTRIQRERFLDEDEYLRLKDSYILVPEKLNAAKEDFSVNNGPLNHGMVTDGESYAWLDDPWPWEYAGNKGV